MADFQNSMLRLIARNCVAGIRLFERKRE